MSGDIEGMLRGEGIDWRATTPEAYERLRRVLLTMAGDLTGDNVVDASDRAELYRLWGAAPEPVIEQGWTDPAPGNGDPPVETPTSLTPIAAWAEVPGRGIVGGDTVGVVAYSKAGINRVAFETGTHAEYHCLQCVDGKYHYTVPSTPNGITYITATVIGNDGGREYLTRSFYSGRDDPNMTVHRGKTYISTGKYGYDIMPEVGRITWFDDCDFVGSGATLAGSSPINFQQGQLTYYTNCRFSNMDMALRDARLVRDCTVEHCGNDAMQSCPLVLGCTVRDIDPVATGWHGDAWQNFGSSPDQVIIAGLHATELHCEGIMCRGNGPIKRVAVVDTSLTFSGAQRKANGPASLWMTGVDHGVFQVTTNALWRFGDDKTPDGKVIVCNLRSCAVDITANPLTYSNTGDKP